MHQSADEAELGEKHSGGFGVIVSDLISLVGHVQASADLIESALAQEADSDHDAANVTVLDNVTPQYVIASCALNACNATLGTALRFLLDARMSRAQLIPSTVD
jgi:hypothetical protein